MVLYLIKKTNVKLQTFDFKVCAGLRKCSALFHEYVLQCYNSSTKGVCPKFPLAAIDFWPETNFCAAFKQTES
jgi:hypothetical protein